MQFNQHILEINKHISFAVVLILRNICVALAVKKNALWICANINIYINHRLKISFPTRLSGTSFILLNSKISTVFRMDYMLEKQSILKFDFTPFLANK